MDTRIKEYQAIMGNDIIFKCYATSLNDFIILFHKDIKRQNKMLLEPVTCCEVRNPGPSVTP